MSPSCSITLSNELEPARHVPIIPSESDPHSTSVILERCGQLSVDTWTGHG